MFDSGLLCCFTKDLLVWMLREIIVTPRWLMVGDANAKIFTKMTTTLLIIMMMIVSFVGRTHILVCARAGGGLWEMF